MTILSATAKTLLVLAFVFPVIISAHATGASFEKNVDGYRVDIGYEPEEIQTGSPGRFDFELLDGETGEPVAFSDIWIRIEQERTLFLAGSVAKGSFGPTGLSYMFPAEGTYTVFVRFQRDGDALVETSFEIDVARGQSEEKALPVFVSLFIATAAGLAVGIGGSILATRRR